MNCTAVALKFRKFESMCFTAYTILGCDYIHDRIIGGVPKNLIKGGRNFLFPFPLKISIKTKKKVYTFFDVKFAPQKQVKAEKKRKSSHGYRRQIYPHMCRPTKKCHRVPRCPVSTVPLTVDVYQLICQRGEGADPAPSSWVRP